MNNSYDILKFLEAEEVDTFLEDSPTDKTLLVEREVEVKKEVKKSNVIVKNPAPAESSSVKANVSNVNNLDELREAILKFNHPLKKTAMNMVFSRGNSNRPKVMFVGEAPGADEDIKGIPFVGRAGQLLDKMIAAINLTEEDFYISNVVNYRPENNRTPNDDEIQAFLPFLEKHIELVKPQIICILGAVSLKALLPDALGITKVHGQWSSYRDIPVIPIYHPAYLLRFASKKGEAWADLQELQKKIESL